MILFINKANFLLFLLLLQSAFEQNELPFKLSAFYRRLLLNACALGKRFEKHSQLENGRPEANEKYALKCMNWCFLSSVSQLH